MLLGILLAVPALCAVAVCLCAGAFENLSWLWLLPVSYLGGFVVCLALLLLFVYLCGQLVNTEKPQEKYSKFYRNIVVQLVGLGKTILCLRFHTQGLEKLPTDGPFMLVCNHLCELDPAFLLHFFPKCRLTFVSKQENKDRFLIGKYMHKLICPLMNRENDREALKTILKCVELLNEDKASVGVFPEGYIKPDRKLHHFRSGVFKIAKKAKVPIVVCTLRNTQFIRYKWKKRTPTHIHLHLVDVVQPEQYSALSTIELGNRIYEMMAEDLGPENISDEA